MEVELVDFRRFERAAFSIADRFTLVTGPSGCGKSTILMAVAFAMDGRGGGKLARYERKRCAVTLRIVDERGTFSIERQKGPGRLVVVDYDGQRYELNEAQAKINARHPNWDVGYVAQRSFEPFLSLTPGDKFAYVERLAFGVGCVDDRAASVSSNVDGIKRTCRELDTRRRRELVGAERRVETLRECFVVDDDDDDDEVDDDASANDDEDDDDAAAQRRLTLQRDGLLVALKRRRADDEALRSTTTRLQVFVEEMRALNEEERRETKGAVIDDDECAVVETNRRRWMAETRSEITRVDAAMTASRERSARRLACSSARQRMREAYARYSGPVDGRPYDAIVESLHCYAQLERQYAQRVNERKALRSLDDDDDETRCLIPFGECPACNVSLSVDGDLRLSLVVPVTTVDETQRASIVARVSARMRARDERSRADDRVVRAADELRAAKDDIVDRFFSDGDVAPQTTSLDALNASALSKALVAERAAYDCTTNARQAFERARAATLVDEKDDGGDDDDDDQSAFDSRPLKDALNAVERLCQRRDRLRRAIADGRRVVTELTASRCKGGGGGDEMSVVDLENEIKAVERRAKRSRRRRFQRRVDAAEAEASRLRETIGAGVKLQTIVACAELEALRAVVDELNARVRRYLVGFFDDAPRITLRLDDRKIVVCARTADELETDVEKCLSGGEFARVSLAFALALAEMFRVATLFLDETLAPLDLDAADSVLRTVKDYYAGRLVCIAHQTTRALFDRVIDVSDYAS